MTEALLVAEDVSAGYHGHPIVHDLNLSVPAGKVVVLLGPNGAGKTTTLLTLSGDLPQLKGEIYINGKRTRSPLYTRAKNGLSFVTEERSVFMRLSVAENLRVGRGDTGRAVELFPELRPLMRRRAGLLSGGEQQMLALARALARDPKILLIDELSLGLAPLVVIRLLDAVRHAAHENGVGVLLVEQHLKHVLRVADEVLVMKRGTDRARGPDRAGAVAARRPRGRIPLGRVGRSRTGVTTRSTGVVPAPPAESPQQLRDWIELTTIGDLLVRAAALRPDADAVVFPEQRQTYGEVLASAEAFARSLAALGIERGETVAVLMPNCLEYVHTLFGCAIARRARAARQRPLQGARARVRAPRRRRSGDRDDRPDLRVRRLRAADRPRDDRRARRCSGTASCSARRRRPVTSTGRRSSAGGDAVSLEEVHRRRCAVGIRDVGRDDVHVRNDRRARRAA